MKIRKPAVAGMFYPDTTEELSGQIEQCYEHELGPGAIPRVNTNGQRKVVALVIPHAGYFYSGPVAAYAYRELANDGIPNTVVILSPNHTGYGAAISVWAKGVWKTPFGDIEIDEELAANILGGIIQADETAHLHEHSIEVQIPWLQYLYKEQIKIVPITMMVQDMVIAKKVGNAISQTGNDIVIIASSDFSHYEPQSTAIEKDRIMIEAIINLNEEELYQQRKFLNSTMCGFGPVASAIVAAKEMQAKEATLLKYATSGDVTGDFSSVVGYASIVIKR